MKAPNGRLSGDGSAQAPRHGGTFWASYPQIFLYPLNFIVLKKIVLKI